MFLGVRGRKHTVYEFVFVDYRPHIVEWRLHRKVSAFTFPAKLTLIDHGFSHLVELAVDAIDGRNSAGVRDIDYVWCGSNNRTVFFMEASIRLMAVSVLHKIETPKPAETGEPWTGYLTQTWLICFEDSLQEPIYDWDEGSGGKRQKVALKHIVQGLNTGWAGSEAKARDQKSVCALEEETIAECVINNMFLVRNRAYSLLREVRSSQIKLENRML